MPTRQNNLDYDPCPYRGFCEKYNTILCNEVSFQEICLPFMDFRFEEKRCERIKEERGSR